MAQSNLFSDLDVYCQMIAKKNFAMKKKRLQKDFLKSLRKANWNKTVNLEKSISYRESGSGSINGVAPNGSMFASNILLIIELPAIEAARPALKPD